MDMLCRENNFFILLLFIIGSLTFTSCKKHKGYDVKEIATIRERTLAKSQSILGKDEYYSIYQMANDSINNWRKHELEGWKYFGNLVNYQLDSIFCVNKTGDKIFFAILRRNVDKDTTGDGISYFYGVKIRNTWYFLNAPYLVLLREWYQKDIHTPLPFEKLKQIATSNIYRGYLIKDNTGDWEINERFFEQVTPLSNRQIGDKIKTEEEYVRFMVEVNWSSDVNATIRKYQEE